MRRTSTILAAVLSAGLLLGSDPVVRPQPVATAEPAATAGIRIDGFPLTGPFRQAAKAMRQGDFAAVQRSLAPVLAQRGAAALRAHLVLGLAAHANERVTLAERELRAAADPGGPLEDWRLFVLADCAAALGNSPLALSSLGELASQHATSPLLSRAMLRGAQIAWEAGEAPVTEDWISRARALGINPKLKPQLDALEWHAATKKGDLERAGRAARRLLVEAPLLASRLGVADALRGPDGKVAWSDLLTARELVERASNLLAAGLEKASIETLEQVAASDRGADWLVQMAKALTESHRGKEALDLLSNPKARRFTDSARARLDWQRAQASLEAATVRRHRHNLPHEERESLRRDARHDFIRVAAESEDPDLTVRALRRLFADLADEGLFERSLNVLRRLRQLDPTDTTGAENLWERGWQAFEQGNSSGAIGYWSELEDLYPRARRSRSARYWSARAYQRLGDKDQARAIFRQIATTPTNDFYRRHALEHLDGALPEKSSIPSSADKARVQWPRDPVLSRAELLSDLGLDDLALEELEIERPKASPRAADALSGWILAREGRRRESMTFLSRAFPPLGTPRQDELPARALELYYPLEYLSIVKRYANAEGLSTPLVMAMIRQESGFDARAKSWAGAHGLMQLMPRTARGLARRLGIHYSLGRLSDPRINIRLGTNYFAHLMHMFNDHVELALAGYNRGPYHIKRLWRRTSPDTGLDRFVEGLDADEARSYVKRILLFADSYSRLYPQLQ